MGVLTRPRVWGQVPTWAVSARSKVFLTRESLGGTAVGHLLVASRTPGAQFVVAAVDGQGRVVEEDEGTLAWFLVEVEP